MNDDEYKTLPEALDCKENLILACKEVDLKLSGINNSRHKLMTAKYALEKKLSKVKAFIRERQILLREEKKPADASALDTQNPGTGEVGK